MRVEYAQIFLVGEPQEVKGKPDLKRWQMIVEHRHDSRDLKLEWISTYNPRLAVKGTHEVQFYRDSSNRKCIRVPRKESNYGNYR